mmetsp:Transcript_31491/g.62220  ORF Transcript_31491/g.62220 Transcript_31491/m.62220 type:complete len:156 (+) Transcript_31491:4749-5216(+)
MKWRFPGGEIEKQAGREKGEDGKQSTALGLQMKKRGKAQLRVQGGRQENFRCSPITAMWSFHEHVHQMKCTRRKGKRRRKIPFIDGSLRGWRLQQVTSESPLFSACSAANAQTKPVNQTALECGFVTLCVTSLYLLSWLTGMCVFSRSCMFMNSL